MTAVRLALPDEVLAALQPSAETERGTDLLTIAVEGISVAANIVTVTAVRQQLPELAAALRRWVLRQPRQRSHRLTVKGDGIDLTVDLPPNVSTQHIVGALNRLLASAGDPPPPSPEE